MPDVWEAAAGDCDASGWRIAGEVDLASVHPSGQSGAEALTVEAGLGMHELVGFVIVFGLPMAFLYAALRIARLAWKGR